MLENPEERQGNVHETMTRLGHAWMFPMSIENKRRPQVMSRMLKTISTRSLLGVKALPKVLTSSHIPPTRWEFSLHLDVPQVYDCIIVKTLQWLVSQVRFTHPHSPWSHALVSLWHQNYAIAICVCTSMSWSPRKLGTLFEITNVAPPPGRLHSSKFHNHIHRLGSCNYRRDPHFLPIEASLDYRVVGCWTLK